jgi:2,4-dienoyl-CoA reductase (NADPH2)
VDRPHLSAPLRLEPVPLPNRLVLPAHLTDYAVDGRTVRLLHHPTGAVEERDVDWLVVAAPPRADDELWTALRGSGLEVHRVGDCLAPRRAGAATLDGDRVGLAV